MIRILFLASNPIDILPLKLEQESRAIDIALRQTAFRERFEFKSHSAVRAADLQGLLLRYQPHIVHFCGHGSLTNEIVLLDDLDNGVPVPPGALERLFAILKDNIQCVVLNACNSEAQARAIAKYVDCVIGMSDAIGDLAAISFSTAFYQAIGYGRDFQSAFELGCLQIDLENLGEQNIPRLLSIVADPAKTVLTAEGTDALTQHSFGIEDIKDYTPAPADPGFLINEQRLKDIEQNDYLFPHLYKDTQSGLINQDRNFSEHIRSQWIQVNKVINILTNDQYRIIHWLRGHKRAAIAGCAGSGKTLIAVEKAIRLDRAGLQTLILCHSPNLAKYIRQLTIGTGVLIYDFNSWITQLIGKDLQRSSLSWSNYFEPLEEELELAFDILSESDMNMDAVIIDEAQDFRDTWWLVVQAALADETNGIMYLFYDDNQALLPNRSQYPIATAPFVLDMNCRNAGQIFDFVRKFHPKAPDVSSFLANQGITKFSTFGPGEEASVVRQAVQDSLQNLTISQLVMLSTETGSIEQSILQSLYGEEKPPWRWQDSVSDNLAIALRHYKGRGFTNTALPTRIPSLSNESEPTQADIHAVVAFAKQISSAQGNSLKNRLDYKPETDRNRWFIRNNKLMLRRFPDASALLSFFQSESWAEHIPVPGKFIIIDAQQLAEGKHPNTIPLYSVASFKGLEADGIILFIRAWNDQLEKRLYVGASRARFYLHLVINHEIMPRIPKI